MLLIFVTDVAYTEKNKFKINGYALDSSEEKKKEEGNFDEVCKAIKTIQSTYSVSNTMHQHTNNIFNHLLAFWIFFYIFNFVV